MDTVKILETIVKQLEQERELWHDNSKAIVVSATNEVLAFAKATLKQAQKEQKESSATVTA